ncbi:molecular chaperone DnaJ [Erythrobacter crassostreae]|uniref:Molecular chaperone DnaJ n=1 Tax=Erythrobacter crassostreae TaxID=2828328 RepID=A0A9X1JM65_9SPHN|nr:molecular chaperone DnaJ [Erythrobacter crassostrea]MBV7258443.1 molecular chaperone DnaJ [Erythrobacter crassostrea]
MLRIAIILVIICILFRWAFGKWPWQGLGGKSTRSQAVFRARKLLGVDERASREQILAAHKRLIAMVHPDKGGSNAAVHEANDARDILLGELPDRGADIGDDGSSQD